MNLLLDKIFTTSDPEGYRVIRSIHAKDDVSDLKSYYEGYEKALDDVMQILEQHHSARNFVLQRLDNINN
jgi:hypothetical protein